MQPQLSVYLDLCRFIAAVVVVLSHLTYFNIATGSWSESLPQSGHDAVILFFLLSGYVIAYTTEQKKNNLTDYVVSRAVRIYSVALPVLLLTVCFDLIGLQFHPENYSGLYQYEKLYIYIPFHLAFLGEIWTISEQPFTVVPYWSLGYEVWYYLLFAVLYYFSGAKRVVIFALLFLFVGYKLWLLFPLWLAGTWLYRNHQRWKLNSFIANLLFFGSIVGYLLYKHYGGASYFINLGQNIWPFEQLSLGSAKKYMNDYIVCLFFFIHLYAARYVNLAWLLVIKKPIVILASYTFTLYLVHAPVMEGIGYNWQLNTDAATTSVIILVLVAIATWGIGLLTEKRKHKFKPAVVFLVNLLVNVINRFPKLKALDMPNKLNKEI